jgi:hypothetical protein
MYLPDNLVEMWISNVVWFGLKLFTVVELKIKKAGQLLKTYLPSSVSAADDSSNANAAQWLFIENGEAVTRVTNNVYDPIFYVMPNASGQTTMVRVKETTRAYDLFQLRPCPTKIYALNLNINDGEISMNIPSRNLNFMIVGNILYDRAFWEWYLLRFHQLILEEKDKYAVAFFDDQMNVVMFTETQCMQCTKNGYEIVPTPKDDDDDDGYDKELVNDVFLPNEIPNEIIEPVEKTDEIFTPPPQADEDVLEEDDDDNSSNDHLAQSDNDFHHVEDADINVVEG